MIAPDRAGVLIPGLAIDEGLHSPLYSFTGHPVGSLELNGRFDPESTVYRDAVIVIFSW